MLLLGLTPEARADLLEARDWYEEQRPGWGDVFTRSVEACFERIRRMPRAFATVHGKVRRAPLRRFPHGVFYWIEDEQIVVSRSGTAAEIPAAGASVSSAAAGRRSRR